MASAASRRLSSPQGLPPPQGFSVATLLVWTMRSTPAASAASMTTRVPRSLASMISQGLSDQRR